jgi:hypothetical protein
MEGLESLLRVWYYKFSEMIKPWWSKMQFFLVVPVCQHRLTTAWLMFKNS